MRAVGGRERVHHEQVAKARERPGKAIVVCAFPGLEAHVLQQDHFAGRHVHATAPVAHHGNGPAERAPQVLGDGHQRQVGIEIAFAGPAEVRHHDHRRIAFDACPDRRQGRDDPRIVRDPAVAQGDVEVLPDQHPLARQRVVAELRGRGLHHSGHPVAMHGGTGFGCS